MIDTDDPTAVGEGLEVISQNAVQLESSPLRVRRTVIRLGDSVLMFQSTNRPIRTRSLLRDGLVAYVAFGPRASGSLNGVPIAPDRVLASPPGVRVEFVVAAGYESAAFLVPPDELRAHLRLRRRAIEPLIPRGVELWQSDTGGATLFDWGRRVAEAAAMRPEVFDDPQTNAVARVDLLEVLLTSLGPAVQADRPPGEPTGSAHSRIVRIAEEYALAHAGKPLYVGQLCDATSVSERTLQNAFNHVVGMTPMAYLARLRLHEVRRALRAAAPGGTTVKAEAAKWGFWHLGEFSRAYRACFGELPSDTLRGGASGS